MARGYLYELATEKDNLGNVTESDFYDKCGVYADYFENLAFYQTATDELLKCLQSRGIDVNFEDKSFILTQETQLNYFKSNYQLFMKMAKDLTLEQFADPGKAYELSRFITDTYSDAVYINAFYDFDDFMRDAELDTRYYIGNVILMH